MDHFCAGNVELETSSLLCLHLPCWVSKMFSFQGFWDTSIYFEQALLTAKPVTLHLCVWLAPHECWKSLLVLQLLVLWIFLIVVGMEQRVCYTDRFQPRKTKAKQKYAKAPLHLCLWILILNTWINTSDKVQSALQKPLLTFLIWVQLHVQWWEAIAGWPRFLNERLCSGSSLYKSELLDNVPSNLLPAESGIFKLWQLPSSDWI